MISLVEYKVVEASFPGKLEQEVREAVRKGYVPIGGVAVSWAPGSFQTWAQALVRYPKTQKPKQVQP